MCHKKKKQQACGTRTSRLSPSNSDNSLRKIMLTVMHGTAQDRLTEHQDISQGGISCWSSSGLIRIIEKVTGLQNRLTKFHDILFVSRKKTADVTTSQMLRLHYL